MATPWEQPCLSSGLSDPGLATCENEVGGIDYMGHGEYLEIDRPRRLVFTFGMPQFSPLFCTVTVEIVADGDGCILILTQDQMAPDAREPVEQGWLGMFDALGATLGA
jgi:uncharacterized protein YndB with AHSA1/START domain